MGDHDSAVCDLHPLGSDTPIGLPTGIIDHSQGTVLTYGKLVHDAPINLLTPHLEKPTCVALY